MNRLCRTYSGLLFYQDQILFKSNPDTDSEFLRYYCDGQTFKQNPFFKGHPNALRLHFYEGEFEVVNPLESKRTKHKLCAFYYTVGNLDKNIDLSRYILI